MTDHHPESVAARRRRENRMTPPVPVGALILADEFNGAVGTKPSSTLWTARTGGSNGSAHYNGLNQCALDGASNLVVTCQKIGGTWQSGFLSTVKHPYKGARYLEARAQVAAGQGAWSAPLWEWCAPYGAGGIENDVCEQLCKSGQPNEYHGTLHNWSVQPSPQKSCPITSSVPLDQGFHVYGSAVYPDRVDYYLDGVKKATATAASVGLKDLTTFEMVAVIDLNIGGWAGTIGTAGPLKMLVDYVHVYALA